MSQDNLPTQNQSPEEVDLGQLFRLIGNAFERFFRFIGSIFQKLFLAFVWLVFFIKRNIIWLVAATLIGLLFGYFKTKFSEPIYSSQVIVKQNYKTGESLNNLINYYNSLIRESDTIALAEGLEIPLDHAASIVGFEMESVLSDNTKLKLYDNFKKEIDSITAASLDFQTFLQSLNDYDFEYQRLIVKSTIKNPKNNILPNIVDYIANIDFFKNEQRKDLAELDLREQAIKESLAESDSLKKIYEKVLQKEDNSLNPSTNILINDATEQNTTKEYELFNNDVTLRRELVQINRSKEDFKNILEIISSSQESRGIIDNKVSFLGIDFSKTIFYALLAFFVTLLVLFGLSLMKFLERFKSKVV